MQNMACPICFEDYSPERPAKGPCDVAPHDCPHTFCAPCGERIKQTSRPPFKCAECRRDITEWFVAEFRVDENPSASAHREEIEALLRGLHEEIAQFRRESEEMHARMHRLTAETEARLRERAEDPGRNIRRRTE